MYPSGASKRHKQPGRAGGGNWRTSNLPAKGAYSPAINRFNSENGLVFTEATVGVPKRQAFDWIGESRNPTTSRRRRNVSSSGAASLLDTAVRSLSLNIRSITPDHLYEVPWELAERVWEEILASGTESFHAWRTFASAFPDEFSVPDKRYLINIREAALPLSDYFRGLDSSPARWLTSLRISPRYTQPADLVNIGSIRNLVVLDLSDDFTIDFPLSTFEERIMKAWVETIATQKAFRHLRAILLGWQEQAAAWIFKYLKHFPSLCCIIFTDCPKIHQKNRPDWEDQATTHGWVARHAKRSAKSLRPIVGDTGFHVGGVSGIYYDTQEAFTQLHHDLKPVGMDESLPMVECWISRPRLWTHMIDEFPGSRTVWFDNANIRDEGRGGKKRGGGSGQGSSSRRSKPTNTSTGAGITTSTTASSSSSSLPPSKGNTTTTVLSTTNPTNQNNSSNISTTAPSPLPTISSLDPPPLPPSSKQPRNQTSKKIKPNSAKSGHKTLEDLLAEFGANG